MHFALFLWSTLSFSLARKNRVVFSGQAKWIYDVLTNWAKLLYSPKNDSRSVPVQIKFKLVQNYRACGLYIKKKKSPDVHFPSILNSVPRGGKRGVGGRNYLQTNRRLSMAVLRGKSYQEIMVRLITQAVRKWWLWLSAPCVCFCSLKEPWVLFSGSQMI